AGVVVVRDQLLQREKSGRSLRGVDVREVEELQLGVMEFCQVAVDEPETLFEYPDRHGLVVDEPHPERIETDEQRREHEVVLPFETVLEPTYELGGGHHLPRDFRRRRSTPLVQTVPQPVEGPSGLLEVPSERLAEAPLRGGAQLSGKVRRGGCTGSRGLGRRRDHDGGTPRRSKKGE